MDAAECRVYVDTSVLANWILNYKGPPKDIHPEKRAQECLELLRQVVNKEFRCRFETSGWAIAELFGVISDNIVALKILRDGFSLRYFNKLKDWYRLNDSESEYSELLLHLKEFRRFLRLHKVKVSRSVISHSVIGDLSCRYALETPDATHVALALARHCQFLVSIDHDLLETKPEIREVEAVLPSDLYTRTELRMK